MLEPTEDIKRVFAQPFSVTYAVTLTHSPTPSLTTSLTVQNPPSSSPLRFQALLHTYLRLPESSSPNEVKISGLKGLEFTDKVQGGKVEKEGRERVGFEAGEVDRVYNGVPSTIEVELGAGKGTTLQTSNLPDVRHLLASLASSIVQAQPSPLRTAHRLEPARRQVGRDERHGVRRLGALRLRRAWADLVRLAESWRVLGGQADAHASTGQDLESRQYSAVVVLQVKSIDCIRT